MKQRARGAVAPPADAEVKTPTPHTLELPEFNLKESDTDVRVPPPNRGHSDVRVLSKDPAQGPGDVFQREGSIGKGPKPPVSSKPSSPLNKQQTSTPPENILHRTSWCTNSNS
ncbi:hypothetical protein CgunFtcFv8_009183 [Champsocephalus gunnari]|uniref:Uncharacterized protein n=1 Tax=Champsocephalus gunnari TaxID=52237 RepID=A0AAN8C1Q2_CHAGU|nr:hypothetical protein CgunFtcFv8_009183 [Champsocephalus gunnari]